MKSGVVSKDSRKGFSNAAYMGFPLIQALYGKEGLLYASVFVTVFNILLWTVGYSMMTGTCQIREIILKILKTPVIYAVIIGLVLFLCQIPVSKMIQQPLSLIGNMNTPLSMIITGMIIAGSSIKKMICNQKIWLTLIIKMLIIPTICIGIFYLLGFHGMVAEVVCVAADNHDVESFRIKK